MSAAQRACEIMKLTRNQAVSAPELSVELGIRENNCREWLREMAANGVLVDFKGGVGRNSGRTEMYTLSPNWGGTYQQKETK